MQRTILIVVAAAVLAGCPAKTPVAKELSRYLEEGYRPLRGLETAVEQDFQRLERLAERGPNRAAPSSLAETLETSIVPNCRDYLRGLEQLQPVSAPVRELHELKLRAARTRCAALEQYRQALLGQSEDQRQAAKQRWAEADELDRRFAGQVDRLKETWLGD